MTRTFLPEANSMPSGRLYRPLYRWHREDNWTLVPGGKTYPSAAAAREAANDHLAKGMNRIRAETMEPVEAAPDPFMADITAWREKRAQEAADERRRAFGEDGARLFMKGREIVVERRRAGR